MPIRALSKELQAKTINELNEDPARIEEDLNKIKEWADKQAHLKIRFDDQWLIGWLRGCRYSLERSKQKLDLLYTMKSLSPEFFTNRDPLIPEIQDILKKGLILPLPKLVDPTAPRVILLRSDNLDYKTNKLDDCLKAALMILDVLIMEDDNFVISGCHAFIDNKKAHSHFLIHVTPTLVKKAQALLLDAYALRPKGFHAINLPQFAETAYNMLKPILNSSIVELVHIYKGDNEMEKLRKAVPISVLPKEYGGDCGTINELTETWKKKVESYRDWLLEDDKYGSDESKRPGKPKTIDELCGIEGSFRKLEFD